MKRSYWLLICALASFFGCTTDTAPGSLGRTVSANVVGPQVPIVTAGVAPTSVVYGQPLTFSWSVAPPSLPAPPFVGTMRFYDLLFGESQFDFHATLDVNGASPSGSFSVDSGTLYPVSGLHTLCAEFQSANSDYYSEAGCADLDVFIPPPTDTTVSVAAAQNPNNTTSFVHGEALRVTYSVTEAIQPAGEMCIDCVPAGPLNGTMLLAYADPNMRELGGEVPLAECPVADGEGQCDVTGVPVGPQFAIVGKFVPDDPAAWLPSYDASSYFAVTPASTTTQITASGSPSVIDATVSIDVQVRPVAPSTLPPTGNVTIYMVGIGPVIAGPLALVPQLAQGFSTVTLPSTAVALVGSAGTKQLYAIYAPDAPGGTANFVGSTSANVSHDVALDGTIRSLSSIPAVWIVGEPISFTLNVANVTPASGTPTGAVLFYDGAPSPASLLGADGLHDSPAGRVATITTSSLVLGAHSITAVYEGDATHSPGSTTLAESVIKATPTVNLIISPKSTVYSQPITFGAQVVGTGTVTPTGTVQFYVGGGTPIGSPVALIGGAASLVDATLAVGDPRAISAEYSGDARYNTASASDNVSIGLEPTSTLLTTSSEPAVAGGPITFTATVSKLGNATATPTGAVDFVEGAVTLAHVTLDGSGVAKLTTSSLPAGSHTIVAQYTGNPNMGASSHSLVQTVNVDGVSVALVSSPNPSVVGDAVAITATFASTSAGAPTGSVELLDGASSLGTAPIAGGKATLTTSALAAGAHTIKVVYGGDPTHEPATGTLSHTVNRLPSTTTLASSAPAITAFGVAVPLTATVTASGGGTPTGTVSFKDGTTVLGTVALDAVGVAHFTASSLEVGSHALTAQFTGDPSHAQSTSETVSHTVEKVTAALTLVTSLSPAPVGYGVVFTAKLTSPAGVAVLPTGTITFTEGATTLGTGTLGAGGLASFSTTSLAGGTHTITAAYAGDAHYSAVSSAPLTQVVSASAAVIALTSSPNPSALGAPVSLNVSVSGGVTPTGNVTFKNGATSLGSAPLDATGKAALTTSTLPPGILSLSAEYSGDATHDAGTATLSHVVQKGATTTALLGSSAGVLGGTLTFTANVSSSSGAVAGDVELFDATTSIGLATISGGSVTFSVSSLTLGQHAVTAMYKGNDTFASSLSNTMIVTISQGAGGGADAGADAGGGTTSGGVGSSSGASSSGSGVADGGGTVGTSSGVSLTPGSGSGSGDDCAMTPGETGSLTAPVLLGLLAVLTRRRRKVAV